MRADLIAWTAVEEELISEATGGFMPDPDAKDGEHLIETAGRLCYGSFRRPNPKTARNSGYIAHVIEVGHFSVLEHANATFLVQGVSRSLSHEFVRHRHFSYSQVSQRYVDESNTEFVVPPLIAQSDAAREAFEDWTQAARRDYAELVELLGEEFPNAKRKEIRQAARSVLPNATETKFVVTGNFRAWWEFLLLRAAEPADVEIRALAVAILRELWKVAPSVFRHFVIATLPDGTEVAHLDEDARDDD